MQSSLPPMQHYNLMEGTTKNHTNINSSSVIKKLSQCSRSELTKLRDKNVQMLSNQSFITTLPDKGAKLIETNQIIDKLLLDGSTATAFDNITVSNTTNLQDCPLSKKLEEMSVLTPGQGARKRSVDLANQQAYNHYASSGLLLTKPKSSLGSGSGNDSGTASIFYNHHNNQHHYYYQQQQPSTFNLMYNNNNDQQAAKVRMLTLDESMSLQKEQRSSVIKSEEQLDFKKPSTSLLNSLNLSIDLIQEVDINQIEFPQEEEDIEDYNHNVEAMVID